MTPAALHSLPLAALPGYAPTRLDREMVRNRIADRLRDAGLVRVSLRCMDEVR